MDIQYIETHIRTLGHRHAHSYILYTHRHACHHRTHSHVCVYSMFPIHTSIQTYCTNWCVCQHPLTPSWPLSLSHAHTLAHSYTQSHTLLHVNIVDKPSLNLSIHILLRPFGRQTMRNDSKWKCTTCSPIRPLSSKPNILCFFSLSAPGL